MAPTVLVEPEKVEETAADGEVPAEGAEETAKTDDDKSPDDKAKATTEDKTKVAATDKDKPTSKEKKK